VVHPDGSALPPGASPTRASARMRPRSRGPHSVSARTSIPLPSNLVSGGARKPAVARAWRQRGHALAPERCTGVVRPHYNLAGCCARPKTQLQWQHTVDLRGSCGAGRALLRGRIESAAGPRAGPPRGPNASAIPPAAAACPFCVLDRPASPPDVRHTGARHEAARQHHTGEDVSCAEPHPLPSRRS